MKTNELGTVGVLTPQYPEVVADGFTWGGLLWNIAWLCLLLAAIFVVSVLFRQVFAALRRRLPIEEKASVLIRSASASAIPGWTALALGVTMTWRGLAAMVAECGGQAGAVDNSLVAGAIYAALIPAIVGAIVWSIAMLEGAIAAFAVQRRRHNSILPTPDGASDG